MPDEPEIERPAVWAYPVTAAVVVGFCFLFWLVLVPPRGPTFAHPSVWDALISSRFIVGVVRLIGLVVAVYLVASIAALLAQRRWLAVFGPFQAQAETRQLVTEVARERDAVVQQLVAAEQEIAALKHEVERSAAAAKGRVPDRREGAT